MNLLLAVLLLLAAPLCAQYRQTGLVIDSSGRKGSMHLYAFSNRTHGIKVIERGNFNNLDAAMKANHCAAGCNGGFYDPEKRPLGLVIASGKTLGAVNTASSLTSGVVYQSGGKLAIERAKTFFPRKVKADQLLQTGPFLIENGKPVAGLSDRKRARRTFIATDGADKWFIAYTPPLTLAQLAESLSKSGATYGFAIKTALNFDGGSSSGLWVDRGDGNHALYLREINPVINFVGIVAK